MKPGSRGVGWGVGMQISEEGAFHVEGISSTKEQRQNQGCYIPGIKMMPVDWHEVSQGVAGKGARGLT